MRKEKLSFKGSQLVTN